MEVVLVTSWLKEAWEVVATGEKEGQKQARDGQNAKKSQFNSQSGYNQ